MAKNSILHKALFLLFFIIFIQYSHVFSQNIVITDNESYTTDSTAVLDVMSTTKGLLIPRLTSDNRIAIDDPAQG